MARKDRTQLRKGDIIRFDRHDRAVVQSDPRPQNRHPNAAWKVLIRDLNDAGKQTGETKEFILFEDTRLDVE